MPGEATWRDVANQSRQDWAIWTNGYNQYKAVSFLPSSANTNIGEYIHACQDPLVYACWWTYTEVLGTVKSIVCLLSKINTMHANNTYRNKYTGVGHIQYLCLHAP